MSTCLRPAVTSRFNTRRVTFSALTLCLAACGGDAPMGPGDDPAITSVHASQDFTCGIDQAGTALCWGVNDEGQLGASAAIFVTSPQIVSADLRFQQLSTKPSARHVCGVTISGDAYCWGENNFGQIGQPSAIFVVGPQLVPGGLSVASIAAGWRSSCAVTTDGDAHCWGRGEWGQLGDGLATGSAVPVAVSGGHTFEKVEVGSNNLVCGLTTAGEILCWGLDQAGSLGTPSSETCVRSDGLELPCATAPRRIASDEVFVDVSAGQSFACGLSVSSQILCWGRNDRGQLGHPTTETCSQGPLAEVPCGRTPSPVFGGIAFASVAAGLDHVCGVTVAGSVHCWGGNSLGQLGNAVVGTDSDVPVLVRGGLTFTNVSAGNEHTCGESTDGHLYCWGSNIWGQLGTGDTRLWLEPARVVLAP